MTTSTTVRALRSGPIGQGARDTVPLALPIVPFAMAVGAATADAGISFAAGYLGGAILMAGSAHLVLTETLGDGGTLLAAAGAAVLVSARFALYSAGLAQWFAAGSRRRSLLLAFPLVDQQFLLCQPRFAEEDDDAWRVRYYLAVTGVLIAAYLASLPIGYVLGDRLPDGAGLHLAAPLAFAGLLGPAIRARADVVAALVAAVAVVSLGPLLGALALPTAAVAGLAVGSRFLEVDA
ncbi:MAG: AzlC family ABC transporter permease [Acidimicrobiales bacterium]|nr:AzlC family ABC transporter permease [Acidimicrobiales bacterium]